MKSVCCGRVFNCNVTDADRQIHRMQIERAQHFAAIDMQQELQQFRQDQHAQFCSKQAEAIGAVMYSKSPILVVIGTGTGKSIIFMLLAYCRGSGTTIVIVLLISLQQDMHGQCEQSGITSAI